MSLGITEILLILVVALLLFGGKRIPEIARALGRASYEYKKAKNIIKDEANELKDAIENTVEKPENLIRLKIPKDLRTSLWKTKVKA